MGFGDGSWDFNDDGKTGFGERMMGEALFDEQADPTQQSGWEPSHKPAVSAHNEASPAPSASGTADHSEKKTPSAGGSGSKAWVAGLLAIIIAAVAIGLLLARSSAAKKDDAAQYYGSCYSYSSRDFGGNTNAPKVSAPAVSHNSHYSYSSGKETYKDQYNAKDYSNAENFYDDNYDDFYDYDEAEQYWEDNS